MAKIVLKDIQKKYKNADDYSVKNFNLEIENGEFIVLVGPSGCGKSTTLRMIAGLEDITDGEFYIDDKLVNNVSSKNRDIAMVFQSYALYPHMSVKDNIGYGLKLRHVPSAERNVKIEEASSYLGLNEYLKRLPRDLSGGQRQRVALARTLVRDAQIYLMDEPLSNLDAKLRASMRAEISRIHMMKNGITIYVTHDQVEAMTMADRIVVMKDGEIQQIGTPEELYKSPRNIFVGEFIGQPSMNVFEVIYNDGYVYTENFAPGYTKTSEESQLSEDEFSTRGFKVRVTEGDKKILDSKGYSGKKLNLGIRPSDIKEEQIYKDLYADCKIKINPFNIEYLGDETIIYFKHCLNDLRSAKVNAQTSAKIDTPHEVVFEATKLHFFDNETGLNIKND